MKKTFKCGKRSKEHHFHTEYIRTVKDIRAILKDFKDNDLFEISKDYSVPLYYEGDEAPQSIKITTNTFIHR